LPGRGAHPTVAVEDGVFAFTLRSGTGPATLRQREADGRVVAHQVLRGYAGAVAVEDGVFAFTLRSGTGPVTLRQRAAGGRVAAHQVPRG
jgi:hypothetical protein